MNGSLSLDTPVRNEEKIGNLEEILIVVANRYNLPMIIELAQPVPERVRLPGGETTARQLLNLLLGKHPDYTWEVRGGIVHAYNRNLKEAPKNFLNWRIKKFMISNSVADVEFRLRAQINKIHRGVKGEGGLGVGMYSTELSQHGLPTRVLQDVTAREVLFQVAQIDRSFYSVVLFPSPGETPAAKYLEIALSKWRFQALSRPDSAPQE